MFICLKKFIFYYIIYFYNMESGGTKNKNPLLEYISKQGKQILPKFYNYFSENDKLQYKNCFNNGII